MHFSRITLAISTLTFITAAPLTGTSVRSEGTLGEILPRVFAQPYAPPPKPTTEVEKRDIIPRIYQQLYPTPIKAVKKRSIFSRVFAQPYAKPFTDIKERSILPRVFAQPYAPPPKPTTKVEKREAQLFETHTGPHPDKP